MKPTPSEKPGKPARQSRPGLSRHEISSRLAELDLAQTSAIRDLEMDISGDSGNEAASVVEEARQLLRR